CSTARSSAGRSRDRCIPSWLLTLCRWASISENVPVATCPGWCTTRTAGSNIERFAMARPWPNKTPSRLSGRRAIRTITPLAEALNSLYKAELIRNKGPWRGIDDVEIATAEWVHWFNTYRPHGALGGATPAAFRADN